VEEFIQQQTHQERRGPALQDLKDDDLFVVDKVGILLSSPHAHAATTPAPAAAVGR
jgi:hypothetical protein